MANKLQNVFSMADYKLHKKIEQLEKEKRQCMNRLKEEKHMFKMSVKLPHRLKGEPCYWNHYGESFHANGDLMNEKETLCAGVPCSGRQQHVKEWTDDVLVIQPQKIYSRKGESAQRRKSVNSKHASCDTLTSHDSEEASGKQNRRPMKHSAQKRPESENPSSSSPKSVCQLRTGSVTAKGKAVEESNRQKESKQHILRLILEQNGRFKNDCDENKEMKKHLNVIVKEKCREKSTLAATEVPDQAAESKKRGDRSGKSVVQSKSVSYGMELGHDSGQVRGLGPNERSRDRHVGLSSKKSVSGSRRAWCEVASERHIAPAKGSRRTEVTKGSYEQTGLHRAHCRLSNEKMAVPDKDPDETSGEKGIVGCGSSDDIIAKKDPAQEKSDVFTREKYREVEDTDGKHNSTASVTPVTTSLNHALVSDEQGGSKNALMVSRAAIHQRHVEAEKEEKRDTQAKINDFFQRLDGTKRRQAHLRASRARSCTLTRSENSRGNDNGPKTNRGKKATEKGYRRASGWPVEIWS